MRKIWDNYDQDHSGIMEFTEFVQFIKELNIKIEGLSTEDLFKKIDSDKSGKIDLEEFINYYRELTSGKEFLGIFETYSHNKKTLNLEEFKRFMLEVQKAKEFTLYDALILFCEFSIDMPKEVKELLKKKFDEKDLQSKEEAEYLKF